MEIILKKDYKGLGYKNEIVEVAPGYARNFLIPKGFALYATDSNKKIVAENMRQAQHKIAKIREEATGIAEKISKMTFVVKVKIGGKGTFFGTVTQQVIADAINAQTNYKIDRRDIKIGSPLKKLGKHSVSVILFKDIKVDVCINIISE
ncbi:MAG: 50S ribosomal protein L9 [Cytophagales bacterium]|jgi:large subunit ribosomal protein L9|nr:50S ribosomal protein L9 [Cytophagales bacterium]